LKISSFFPIPSDHPPVWTRPKGNQLLHNDTFTRFAREEKPRSFTTQSNYTGKQRVVLRGIKMLSILIIFSDVEKDSIATAAATVFSNISSSNNSNKDVFQYQ